MRDQGTPETCLLATASAKITSKVGQDLTAPEGDRIFAMETYRKRFPKESRRRVVL